jgi:glycosyltransferase involved in cell wall biosynthesis
MKISFCLITLNEEQNLPRCLQSCAAVADEVVVLDSGSTDATESIARARGARWQRQDWLGYASQKNKALSLATHEWAFSLDADEELSPALRAEIRALKQIEVAGEVSGFSLPRCVCYGGRWIRHGDWYPDRLPRLFRRSRAKFVGGRVHERLEIAGRILPLRGELYHYSFRDTADHRERCRRYARLWAEDKFEAGKATGPLSPWAHASFRWLRGYLLRGGFLDGAPGWRIAEVCAWEVFMKYQLLREMHRARGR